MINYMNFKLNVSPSPTDERDFIFSSSKEYPEELDYRDELQPIRNQGDQGSCWAQSACCMKEWQERRESGLNEYLSPQFFYNNRYNIYDKDKDNDYGMYGRDTMRILKNIGVCLEKTYNYGIIQDKSDIPKQCYKEALKYKIKSYARVYGVKQLKKSLFINGPCLISFPVNNKGVKMWQKKEGETNSYGGHAMTIVGYNNEGFIIRNSWGKDWGTNGYCIYPYQDWGSHWEIWTTVDDEIKTYPNYKYCVWLLPEGRYWYNVNKSIIPHMSVKTHLKMSDALNLHKSLVTDLKHKFIKTYLDDNFLITNDNGFTALQYNLYYSEGNSREKPVWWPKEAHISLLYKYHEGVTDSEKKNMNKHNIKKFALFGTPCVVLCKGHHSEWPIIKI